MEKFAEIEGLNTPEEFADWLWKMLILLYHFPNSKDAQTLKSWSREQEGPVYILTHIYKNCVPENKRLMFRQAIGKLLHRHGKEENSPADLFLNFVYLDFIYLIPKNEAVGMLGPLAEAVKKKLASKKEPGIIHSTLAVLLHFSPSREAYDAMSLLADGDDFVGEYLFMAIKILVKCEPTQTEAIVTRFKPRIAERFWITRHGEKKKLGHFWGTIQTTFSREEDVVVRNIILKFLSEQSY